MITDANLRRPGVDVFAAAMGRLPHGTASAIRSLGQLRTFGDGQSVLRTGALAPSAFLLLEGRVRMAGVTPEGEEVLLRWFLPGEFVGLASVLGNLPLPAEVVAIGTVEAIGLDATALKRHLATDPEGAMEFARIVSTFASELAELFVSFAASRLDRRILGVLQRFAAHEPNATRDREIRLEVSQQDLAHAVGASRQRVSVELRKLEEAGWIKLGYRHLVLLRMQAR